MKHRSRQLLVSGASIIILLAIFFPIWNADKNNEYSSLAMSIHLILALLAAILFGIISLITLNTKKGPIDFIYWHNFVGILNMFLSVLLGFFLYADSGHKFSILLSFIALPLMFGILILKEVFCSKILRE